MKSLAVEDKYKEEAWQREETKSDVVQFCNHLVLTNGIHYLQKRYQNDHSSIGIHTINQPFQITIHF